MQVTLLVLKRNTTIFTGNSNGDDFIHLHSPLT